MVHPIATHVTSQITNVLASGLKPIEPLAELGLNWGIFDILGSLRLALVLRQLRDMERKKALRDVEKGRTLRLPEEPAFVKDLVTILVVVWGGEALVGPWLQITPGFITAPGFVLLFALAHVVISILPAIPPMSLQTELPLAFFDALTRTVLLTAGTPVPILKHANPVISQSPWSLAISTLLMANGGFFLVGMFSMLSPYGYAVRTPVEFMPGGWKTMDLWVAPFISCLHSMLTHAQPNWIPVHQWLIARAERRGYDTSALYQELVVEKPDGELVIGTDIGPWNVDTSKAICVIILATLFSYRTIVQFGGEQLARRKRTASTTGVSTKRHSKSVSTQKISRL